MERQKDNNTQDIDVLKQKLATYKQTLETLKAGNAIEDYLIMKNEWYGILKQVSKVEGELKSMQEKQTVQLKEYGKQVGNISEQVESVQKSLENLKEDVTLLTSKVENLHSNEFLKKIENLLYTVIETTSSKEVEKNEMKILKEEIAELKKQQTTQSEETSRKKVIPKRQPSSYNQLKNMLQSSNNVHSSLNSQRSMVDSYVNQRNPLQASQQIGPLRGSMNKYERNNHIVKTNGASQNQRENQLIIKKRKKVNNSLKDSGVLNNKTEVSKMNKIAEGEHQLENSPQPNQDHSTFNQNLDSNTSTERIALKETQKNVPEISSAHQVEIQEETVKKAPVQQGIKPEESDIQYVEEKHEQPIEQLNELPTVKPTDTEKGFTDEQAENKVEEKPSFFSFLQRSKYLGK
jgi:hypothetical protein